MLIAEITQFAYFALTITVEKLHKTNSTAFIKFLDMHILPTVSIFSSRTSKEGLKEKELTGCLISFLPCHHL